MLRGMGAAVLVKLHLLRGSNKRRQTAKAYDHKKANGGTALHVKSLRGLCAFVAR